MRRRRSRQIAEDLGIAESGLHHRSAQTDADEGKRKDLSSDEEAELVRLRRENRTQAVEMEIVKADQRLLRSGERAPDWGLRLVREPTGEAYPVAVACRVLAFRRRATTSRSHAVAPPPARGSDLALITFRASSVLDVSGRTVVGWSITDPLRTELVVNALEMARLRRKPVRTILRSERGTR